MYKSKNKRRQEKKESQGRSVPTPQFVKTGKAFRKRVGRAFVYDV